MTRARKSDLKESQNYEFFVEGDEHDVAAIEIRLKAWIVCKLILARAKRFIRNLKNILRNW